MYGTNVCPSWEMDWSFLRELLVAILYYFCGALDYLVSGLIPHSIHLFGWSCLRCLQRVEPSTGMLQNFSAMSLDSCTVVWDTLTGIWHRFRFCRTTVIRWHIQAVWLLYDCRTTNGKTAHHEVGRWLQSVSSLQPWVPVCRNVLFVYVLQDTR